MKSTIALGILLFAWNTSLALQVTQNPSCLVLMTLLGNKESAPDIKLRSLDEIETLTLIQYNEENVRVLPPNQRPAPFRHNKNGQFKDPVLVAEEKALAEKWNGDFMALEEIYDPASLLAVSPKEDTPIFINGNDPDRHIAFEAKDDLPFFVDVESHANITWNDPDNNQIGKIFARDLPVLLVKASKEGAPFLIIIGNHAKSQRDRPNDPKSSDLATEEYKTAEEIIAEYEKKYPDAAIVAPGDYNRDIPTAPEVKPILNELVSPFDVKGIPVGSESRVTQVFFPREGGQVNSQLDDILISKNLENFVVSIEVIPNTDSHGNPIPLPKSFAERQKNPSDHLAVKLVIKIKPFIQQALNQKNSLAGVAP